LCLTITETFVANIQWTCSEQFVEL
jgi:hypothetical protein